MSPLISVIVVNFNGAEFLPRCLDSLRRQTWPNLEILVVDNASHDGSSLLVRRRFESEVRLIQLTENRGFAGGTNAGLAKARGELVAFLNNDARAASDWLERLATALLEAPEAGMCACKILLEDDRIIDKAGHLIYPDGQNRGRGTGQIDQGQFDELEEALFPDGCAALYRRRAIEEAGGLDEDFFAYADDADLGLRIRRLGWGCLYVPKARVWHRQSATTNLYAPQKIYWVERNRLWLAVKNFPLPLLLLNPGFTVYRWGWNLVAAALGRGAAGNFSGRHSRRVLVTTWWRALRDGCLGVPRMWRKRRPRGRRHGLSNIELLCLLWRFRISARELAFQDRPGADPSNREHANAGPV